MMAPRARGEEVKRALTGGGLSRGLLRPQGDFAHNLKLLQRYPPVDVQTILIEAARLRTIEPSAQEFRA